MGTYIARRLLFMIPTLVGITFLVFMLIAMSPGGVGDALQFSAGGGRESSKAAQQQAYLEDRYGLDDPAVMQYLRWLGRISPIKFGVRDQVSASGELVRAPKALRPPLLIDWWGDATVLPVEPPPVDGDVQASDEERIERFRRAEIDYARARGAYIAATSDLKTALRRYAKPAELPHGVGRTQEIVPRVFARSEPRRDLPEWDAIPAMGSKAIEAFGAAQVARAELAGAFAAKPFPEAGFPIVPGLVSVAVPDLG
ncbi:MAG: hypothetical protein KDA22_04570, partial [Phycisphaerales bacterium]|nr:hypothetical protein [Phycisphaerales bacterium]